MLPWITSPTAARSADAIRSNNAPAPRFRKKKRGAGILLSCGRMRAPLTLSARIRRHCARLHRRLCTGMATTVRQSSSSAHRAQPAALGWHPYTAAPGLHPHTAPAASAPGVTPHAPAHTQRLGHTRTQGRAHVDAHGLAHVPAHGLVQLPAHVPAHGLAQPLAHELAPPAHVPQPPSLKSAPGHISSRRVRYAYASSRSV